MIPGSLASIIAALACTAAPAAETSSWPQRPIRVLIGLAPGGTQDFVARAVSGPLAQQLEQPVVLDNRVGAGGILAADIVSKAAPTGYTLLHTSSAFVINPSIRLKLPYDPFRDFAPVTMLASSTGYVLVVNPSVRATNLNEFIALARNPDNGVMFGSAGVGNNLHLIGELFNLRAGTHLRHVPYKGGVPAVAAVTGGEVQSLFATTTALLLQQVKSGKLRALAFSGASRWALLPELPTMDEAGLPGFTYLGAWHGWLAPAKTPPEIVFRLQREVQKTLQIPKVRETLLHGGYEPVGNTPDAFQKIMRKEFGDFAKAVKAAGIKPE